MPGTDFWIHPPALRLHAGVVDQWAEMTASAVGWVEAHPLEDGGDHLAYARGAEAATATRRSVLTWHRHLESVLRGVARELRDVADGAERLDLETQAQLDAVDPGVYVGFETHYPGGSGELADPEDQYDDSLLMFGYPPPGGGAGFYCDPGPLYEDLNDFSRSLVPDDLLSPTGWIETILGWLGEPDIGHRVMQDFGGRWGDLHYFADTLSGLGRMVTEMHDSLSHSAFALGQYWKGYAAESAQEYFDALTTALSHAGKLFTDLGRRFREYCEGVEKEAESIAGMLSALLDLVIVAAIAAIVGTAGSETVVVGVAGWGTTGACLLAAAKKLYDINGVLQNIKLFAEAADSLALAHTPLDDFTSTITVPSMVDAP